MADVHWQWRSIIITITFTGDVSDNYDKVTSNDTCCLSSPTDDGNNNNERWA
ncbi:hypothetical protein Hjap01_04314 [Haloarcula japonica]